MNLVEGDKVLCVLLSQKALVSIVLVSDVSNVLVHYSVELFMFRILL